MSTFLKFTLPALFGVIGLAVAICLATGSNQSVESNLPVSHAVVGPIAQQAHPLNCFPNFISESVALVTHEKQVLPTNSTSEISNPNSEKVEVSTQSTPETPPAARVAQGSLGDILPLLEKVQDPEALKQMITPNATFQSEGGAAPTAIDILNKLSEKQNQQTDTPPVDPLPASPLPTVESVNPVDENRSGTLIQRSGDEGDDRLSLTIPGEDLNKVLQLLSAQGDLNILASKSVQGTVSASLKNVDIETALDAILKSTGYIWWQDGRFIHVGTPQDRIAMQQSGDNIGTRLYRPNYVTAAELQTLITPMLTQDIGTISVTSPSQVGIAPDGNTAGGDSFAGQEALLVRDYEIVLAEIDQIVQQVDLRPTQVAIEAMILSVNLSDKDELGVDFEVLRDRDHIRVASGNPLGSLAQMDFSSGGLKVGFLDSSLAMFLNALESVGDTNVIATPRLMCLNKHRAEILIGEQLGYVSTTQTETSTTQSVEFLEVGTQLRLRPFISSDGMVRMEVHPELSTGNVRLVGNFTLPDKQVTQVTTNIMVRDGCTVIIGGLLRDQMATTATQIPLFGSLPVIGPAFRKNTEELGRQEILVLITPRVVYEPETCCRGDEAAGEFLHRQAVYADQMSPFSKRYLGRKYFRLAQMAWDAGNARQALRLVNLAIHFDPLNRKSIDLRADIWNGSPLGDHTLPPERGGPALDGEQMPNWIMHRLDPSAAGVNHPLDRGRPGNQYDIHRPEIPARLPKLPPAGVEPISQPAPPRNTQKPGPQGYSPVRY